MAGPDDGGGICSTVRSEIGFPIEILFPKFISCGYLYRNKFSCVWFYFQKLDTVPSASFCDLINFGSLTGSFLCHYCKKGNENAD